MPYNNTPINPAHDVKGTTHLPMSRVKKVLAVDDEINQVSNHAVFLCTRAAELFVRQLAEQAFLADKGRGGGASSSKSGGTKKSLQYDDIARLVHRTDNLEFLCDVIPESTTYSRYKRDRRRKDDVLAEKKAKRAATGSGGGASGGGGGGAAPGGKGGSALAAGQTTLDMGRGGGTKASGPGGDGMSADGEGVGASGGGGSSSIGSRPGTSAATSVPLDAMLNDGPGPTSSTPQHQHQQQYHQQQPSPATYPTGPDAQLMNGMGRDIRFKHYEPRAPNGTGSRDDGDGDGDVHMQG